MTTAGALKRSEGRPYGSNRPTRGPGPQPLPVEEPLSEAHARSIHARTAADAVADRLVTDLAKHKTWTPEDRELALAVAMIWLPQTTSRLGTAWANRQPTRSASPTLTARRLLVERRLREVSPEVFYASAEALLSAVQLHERDPVMLNAVLHSFLAAMRHQRRDLDDLPDEVMGRIRRFVGVLQGHLYSGDYRRGSRYCASPELLLCLVSEMWRETVPLASVLRPALEQAIRWEIQVEVAETPLSRAALMIAAENLHLEGVDPREQRLELLDLQDERGGFRPTAIRRVDGSTFPAGYLLTQILVARALGGQPRTGPRYRVA